MCMLHSSHGDSNTIELTQRARHAVATRLVTNERHVSSTTFVARFTDVLFCHNTCQVCDHVIVPINVIVK